MYMYINIFHIVCFVDVRDAYDGIIKKRKNALKVIVLKEKRLRSPNRQMSNKVNGLFIMLPFIPVYE